MDGCQRSSAGRTTNDSGILDNHRTGRPCSPLPLRTHPSVDTALGHFPTLRNVSKHGLEANRPTTPERLDPTRLTRSVRFGDADVPSSPLLYNQHLSRQETATRHATPRVRKGCSTHPYTFRHVDSAYIHTYIRSTDTRRYTWGARAHTSLRAHRDGRGEGSAPRFAVLFACLLGWAMQSVCPVGVREGYGRGACLVDWLSVWVV
ncbi:uncharacterized protein J3D65DRAFT_105676 [Phyllosticta citribraziliensis]|uniref:Uncharacterized protein n=1 Tax=Phyllosticta citribraziliensis TaxID=989973 RepID=A0ABR1LB14_9PEZI